MKGVKILVAKKHFRKLVDEIQEFLDREAKIGNILPKEKLEIEAEISSSNALVALYEKHVIGYITLGFWPGFIEIRSVVVRSDYRKCGIGSKLIKRAIILAQKQYPNLQIIALAGSMSKNIFLKQGMTPIPKYSLPKQLWDICSGCKDFNKFPGCHCVSLIHKESKITNMIEVLTSESPHLILTAELYCRIWQESPWNEDFWTVDGVIGDIKKEMDNCCARGYIVTVADKLSGSRQEVVGFTWGCEVSQEALREITGHCQLDRFFKKGERSFYINELAIAKEYRHYGLAKELSWRLLSFVEMAGMDSVFLRTDIKAVAARSLYQELGFKELPVFDDKYLNRSYWLLDLGHNTLKDKKE